MTSTPLSRGLPTGVPPFVPSRLVRLGPGVAAPVSPRAAQLQQRQGPSARTHATPTMSLTRPPTLSPAGLRPPRRWVARHKALSTLLLLAMLGATAGIAALLIRQDVTTNPSTTAPDVTFVAGTDYATINAAGFATLTIGSSGASATLALSGVSGAALVTLGNVMRLTNSDATVAYDVTLARSAVPNAAITSFIVTIKDGGTTLLTWDAVSAATSGTFNLDVSKTLDITIALVVTDGTAAGALGSFGMQFSLTPA